MRYAVLLLLVPCLCFAGPESIVFESLGFLADFDSTVVSGADNSFTDGSVQVNSQSMAVFGTTAGSAGGATGYGSMTGGIYNTIRFYFYLSSDWDMAAASAVFEVLDGAQTHIKIRVVDTEEWQVRVWDKTATPGAWTAMTTPTKEEWHLVEVYMHARDAVFGTYALWVYIDGVKEYEVRDTMAGIVLDHFYVGLGDIDEGDVGTIYFDDIVVDTMRWTHGADYRPVDGSIPEVRSTFGLMSGGLD